VTHRLSFIPLALAALLVSSIAAAQTPQPKPAGASKPRIVIQPRADKRPPAAPKQTPAPRAPKASPPIVIPGPGPSAPRTGPQEAPPPLILPGPITLPEIFTPLPAPSGRPRIIIRVPKPNN